MSGVAETPAEVERATPEVGRRPANPAAGMPELLTGGNVTAVDCIGVRIDSGGGVTSGGESESGEPGEGDGDDTAGDGVGAKLPDNGDVGSGTGVTTGAPPCGVSAAAWGRAPGVLRARTSGEVPHRPPPPAERRRGWCARGGGIAGSTRSPWRGGERRDRLGTDMHGVVLAVGSAAETAAEAAPEVAMVGVTQVGDTGEAVSIAASLLPSSSTLLLPSPAHGM